MRIGRPTIWASAAVTALCAIALVALLIVSNTSAKSTSKPRRYIDYLPTSQTSEPAVNQCSLPLAQRTGGWTCNP